MLLLHAQNDSHSRYSAYLAEILRLEGFADFAELDIEEIKAKTLAQQDLVILPRLSTSAAEAELLYNYVAQGGRLLAFSGDSAWTESLVDVSDESDVFICECGLAEPGRPKHVALSQLRQQRGRLKCGRLLLTHLGQEMLDLLPLPDFEVLEDGQEFSV